MIKESKYLIKIPESNVSVFYCQNRKVIFINSSKKTYLINLKLKLYFINSGAFYVTDIPFSYGSTKEKKNLKTLQGTTYSMLTKIFYEISYKVYTKLRLVGIGFKSFNVSCGDLKLIEFRLGYSHKIYFKVPNDLKITCCNSTVIFIEGSSLNKVTQTASILRGYKIPDVYKGKGILYKNEIISLKQGKKV